MAVRRVDFDGAFWGWPSRTDWCEFVRRFGFDPNLVAVPGFVEADDEARTISAECYVRAENGNLVIDETGDAAVRVVRVVQLESPALPMPRAIT